MSLSYPLVNGNRYSFASIELVLSTGGRFVGVSEINYSDTLEPGAVRGTHPQKIGRTLGDYEAEADITLYKSEAQLFLQALGNGYMTKVFSAFVSYVEFDGALPVILDQIVGCRIKGIEEGHAQGTEPLKMKFMLDPMYIVRNGKTPLPPELLSKLTDAAAQAFNK